MASDQRLHPVSIAFSLASHARELLLPGLAAALIAFQSGEWGWQAVAMVLFIPYTLVSLARWLSFRYRLEDDELVINTGLVFRSVRHIPYSRIHNIDAVQNVLHRLFRVASVRIETGGGAEAEASIEVLGLEAIQEMRRHVLARRAALVEPGDSTPAPDDVVLKLSARDLMLSGFIQNRGVLVFGALLGVLWEFGLVETVTERIVGESLPGRGLARRFLLALVGHGEMPVMPLLAAAGGFVLLLLGLRVLSMIWALVSLHGYTLVRQQDDLRAEFGLLTRVMATTPLGRIQTVIVQEGPLHRMFRRASVRVQTAGDAAGGDDETPLREVVAPIIRAAELLALLTRLQPEVDMAAVDWQAPHPRAFRRSLVESAVTAVLLSSWLAAMLRWWWLALLPVLLGWAFVHARLYVKHLRWGTTERALVLRSGWLWRRMTIVRFARIQVVTIAESPFDRRHGMAAILVDTLGAGGAHPMDIPCLGRDTAMRLCDHLAGRAAETELRP
jgi:putative membrane protein